MLNMIQKIKMSLNTVNCQRFNIPHSSGEGGTETQSYVTTEGMRLGYF